jgi:hypothetical protein
VRFCWWNPGRRSPAVRDRLPWAGLSRAFSPGASSDAPLLVGLLCEARSMALNRLAVAGTSPPGRAALLGSPRGRAGLLGSGRGRAALSCFAGSLARGGLVLGFQLWSFVGCVPSRRSVVRGSIHGAEPAGSRGNFAAGTGGAPRVTPGTGGAHLLRGIAGPGRACPGISTLELRRMRLFSSVCCARLDPWH